MRASINYQTTKHLKTRKHAQILYTTFTVTKKKIYLGFELSIFKCANTSLADTPSSSPACNTSINLSSTALITEK